MIKPKFPASFAKKVVRELLPYILPFSSRLIVAGSLRRRKPMVGDIEIIYVPKFGASVDPQDMFGHSVQANLTDSCFDKLINLGILKKRFNVNGQEIWGDKNKLALHVSSGIPIDLFSTSHDAWFNYLVCRTGGAENNVAIASAAQRIGWKWNPYDVGFSRPSGCGLEVQKVKSEEDVFDFVKLPFLEPWERK